MFRMLKASPRPSTRWLLTIRHVSGCSLSPAFPFEFPGLLFVLLFFLNK